MKKTVQKKQKKNPENPSSVYRQKRVSVKKSKDPESNRIRLLQEKGKEIQKINPPFTGRKEFRKKEN